MAKHKLPYHSKTLISGLAILVMFSILVACALETQMRFAAEPWGEIGELRIGAGLHAGEAEFQASAGTPEGDYFGGPTRKTI